MEDFAAVLSCLNFFRECSASLPKWNISSWNGLELYVSKVQLYKRNLPTTLV